MRVPAQKTILGLILVASLLLAAASTANAEPVGQLKICKVAGPGVPVGTPFMFDVTVGGTTTPYIVPAGAAQQGGYCVFDGTYTVGTDVTVQEIPIGFFVTTITFSGPGTLASSNVATGTAVVTIGPGINELTFTNSVFTAVQLTRFTGTRSGRAVVLRWHTGTEADLLGFQVYRSQGHSWRRVTRSLIAAKGSVSGASYRFLDKTARRGVAYRYRIRAVNRDGSTSWFGLVRVT